WAPSPARPGCSARPAHPAPRSAGCTPPSTSRCPRGSWTSPPSSPQRADQEQHPRLVTRHVTRPTPVCPAETPHSSTFTGRQLRNPGAGDVAFEAADDVFFGEAFGGAAFDVGAGGRVVAHAGEHDPVEGGVGLPVSSPVEPVAAGPPGGGGQWCGGAEHGERRL